MKHFDCIIIGAGVVGCAVARALSLYDMSLGVIDRASDVAEGASKANSGLVHAGFDAPEGSLKAKFNVRGNEMFEPLCDALGVKFKRNGALVVAFSEEDVPKLYALLERGKRNGVENLSILPREQLRRKEPNLSENAVAALYAPSAGMVCPYGLTAALADFAAVNGASFLFEHKVQSVERISDDTADCSSSRSAGGDGTARFLIYTDKGDFTAGVLVNAAGVHSDEINNMLSKEKLTITPRRGEYYMVDRARDGLFESTVFSTPTKVSKGILVSPTVDGTLLIGPTAYEAESKDDVSVTAKGLSSVFSAAKGICPSLSRRDLFAVFAGNRASGDRGDFVMGEAADVPYFFNAAAVESPGLSASPAIGEYLADAVAQRIGAEKKPNHQLSAYEKPPLRFYDMAEAEREEAIKRDPNYAAVVCRCELVTEAEIRASIRRPVGARSLDGVKKRTRAGMGRCQSGFCCPRVAEILAEEMGVPIGEVTKSGGNSRIITGSICSDANGGGEETSGGGGALK
ncbi:MAG: NAD(P)/FAD-dependent oxidoreductase [Oscillospiraceae bacterium]|jgi:glycerol-3-phosphate dehydrogenase|nr:NAD(P)/FAD-dependent oxidoreductase [Oscillospiraceae bacterium]